MSVFEKCFGIVVGIEGGFTTNSRDKGNWTGGQLGVGQLKGTKYGISAAAYPRLDIANLTQQEAMDIYQSDFWNDISGDLLPAPLGLVVFDFAVNSGVHASGTLLQRILRVNNIDGIIGPVTLKALDMWSGKGVALITEYQSQRLYFLTGLPSWGDFGLGWTRRVVSIGLKSLQMG